MGADSNEGTYKAQRIILVQCPGILSKHLRDSEGLCKNIPDFALNIVLHIGERFYNVIVIGNE